MLLMLFDAKHVAHVVWYKTLLILCDIKHVVHVVILNMLLMLCDVCACQTTTSEGLDSGAAGGETATSSEFENFLSQRIREAERLPSVGEHGADSTAGKTSNNELFSLWTSSSRTEALVGALVVWHVHNAVTTAYLCLSAY